MKKSFCQRGILNDYDLKGEKMLDGGEDKDMPN